MTPFAIFCLCVLVACIGYYTGSLDGYIDGHARGRKEGEATAVRYLLKPADCYHQDTKTPNTNSPLVPSCLGGEKQLPTPDWHAANPNGKSYIIFDPAVADRLKLTIEKQFRPETK